MLIKLFKTNGEFVWLNKGHITAVQDNEDTGNCWVYVLNDETPWPIRGSAQDVARLVNGAC